MLRTVCLSVCCLTSDGSRGYEGMKSPQSSRAYSQRSNCHSTYYTTLYYTLSNRHSTYYTSLYYTLSNRHSTYYTRLYDTLRRHTPLNSILVKACGVQSSPHKEIGSLPL